jgi:hypothetical protein
MIEATPVEELNSVRYLYLRELSDSQNNSLKLIVEEAIVNRAGVVGFHPGLENILKDASPSAPHLQLSRFPAFPQDFKIRNQNFMEITMCAMAVYANRWWN